MRRSPLLPKLVALACLLTPWAAWACPRCVDATPYGKGLLLAVLVILPLPLLMGSALYVWIRKAEKEA